jgi:predicted dehydrogenase
MGTHHARVLHTLDGAQLVAAVDPDLERRKRIAVAHLGVATYASLAEAVAGERLDFACVAFRSTSFRPWAAMPSPLVCTSSSRSRPRRATTRRAG